MMGLIVLKLIIFFSCVFCVCVFVVVSLACCCIGFIFSPSCLFSLSFFFQFFQRNTCTCTTGRTGTSEFVPGTGSNDSFLARLVEEGLELWFDSFVPVLKVLKYITQKMRKKYIELIINTIMVYMY